MTRFWKYKNSILTYKTDQYLVKELDCFSVVWASRYGWSDSLRSFTFYVFRREVSECMCGLSFVFSVPVKNCAVCGRLGCNRWSRLGWITAPSWLCKWSLDASIAARYYPGMLWRLKKMSQLITTIFTTNIAKTGLQGEEHCNNLTYEFFAPPWQFQNLLLTSGAIQCAEAVTKIGTSNAKITRQIFMWCNNQHYSCGYKLSSRNTKRHKSQSSLDKLNVMYIPFSV